MGVELIVWAAKNSGDSLGHLNFSEPSLRGSGTANIAEVVYRPDDGVVVGEVEVVHWWLNQVAVFACPRRVLVNHAMMIATHRTNFGEVIEPFTVAFFKMMDFSGIKNAMRNLTNRMRHQVSLSQKRVGFQFHLPSRRNRL